MGAEEGTHPYVARHEDRFSDSYFERIGGKPVSSIGIGTHPGDATDEADESYYEALVYALENGINVVDTSVTYRCQRSERVVSDAIADADVDRSEVFVATKGGFIPYDGSPPSDRDAYLEREFVETGLLTRDDLVEGIHTLNPAFLERMIETSLENLGVESVDLYYLHNPERQLHERSRAAVYDRIEAAFELLEAKRNEGAISFYGVASWESFRVPRDADKYLSIQEITRRARSAAATAGNSDHGLAAIQLPLNLGMTEASSLEEQPVEREGSGGETLCSAVEAANRLGLHVFTSASLGQENLLGNIPDAVAAQFSGETPAQSAINFVRSHPGVTTALVGMDEQRFVEENVAAGRHEPV